MAYAENSAPLRTKSVGVRQFAAMKGQLRLVFNKEARAEAVRAWNNYVPLSPKTAFEMLTRELPQGTQVEFRRMDIHGGGYLKIFKYDEENGGDLLSDLRDFDLLAREAGMGFVEVAPQAQGRGLGRRLMRNQIEFFHACGVRRFNIYASNNNGGYTWARMGFLPQEPAEEDSYSGVRRKVEGELAVLAPVIGRRWGARVRDLLRFEKETDLWALADLDLDLAPLVGARKDFRGMVRAGEALPLGRVLLSGTDWDGTLDLRDARQMARVEKYCGGFAFIK